MSKALGNKGPKIVLHQGDGLDHLRCSYCKARLDYITPWNQPHLCKEMTYGTAVLLPRFETFT